MISFYILSKKFLLKRKGLFDAQVAPIAKRENGFAVYYLQRLIVINPIQDELFWDYSWMGMGGRSKRIPSLKSVTHIL